MPINLATFDPQPIAAALPGLGLGRKLGHGGQKAVWECTFQGNRYVLKVLAEDPNSSERAKRELEVYRRCTGPFLPRVGPLTLTSLCIGTDSILYYLETFIAGTTLDRIPKPMPQQDVIAMANCIIGAVEELWKNGFIHRDIKPQNIMRRVGTQEYVLLDAGLVLDAAGPSLTQTGGIVGTLGYLSTDQLQMNKRDLDFRSDLFAVGICMYECLTGQHPFWNADLPAGDINHNTVQYPSPPPQRWDGTLNPELCNVVMRLLEKERHLRYSRFQHLRDDLAGIVI